MHLFPDVLFKDFIHKHYFFFTVKVAPFIILTLFRVNVHYFDRSRARLHYFRRTVRKKGNVSTTKPRQLLTSPDDDARYPLALGIPRARLHFVISNPPEMDYNPRHAALDTSALSVERAIFKWSVITK